MGRQPKREGPWEAPSEERQGITREAFIEHLLRMAPETEPLVDEHLAEQGELLLHMLMSDLLRFATAEFASGHTHVSHRVLRSVDQCLGRGDDEVENAVAVSFVEYFGAWPGETQAFLATWPEGLRAELRCQQRGYKRQRRRLN